MLIGSGGAGKSTLAKKLNDVTGIPLIHLDKHFWNPDWVETEKEKWTQLVMEIAEKETWIIDGNYGGTMDIRLARASTVIFMNLSGWLCTLRVMKRLIQSYGKTRPDMAKGCRERFSWNFMKYVWNYPKTRKPKILQKLSGLPKETQVFILKSPGEVRSFLQKVQDKSIQF